MLLQPCWQAHAFGLRLRAQPARGFDTLGRAQALELMQQVEQHEGHARRGKPKVDSFARSLEGVHGEDGAVAILVDGLGAYCVCCGRALVPVGR